jgi:hypothetical protein
VEIVKVRIFTQTIGDGARLGFLVAAAVTVGLLAPSASTAAGPAHDPGFHTAAAPAVATLRLGSRGADVRSLQRSLARLSFLPSSGVDGAFGAQTWHAVVAFQGWNHLQRDGVVGPRTRTALGRARLPTPWSTATGLEIHVAEQVLLLVRDRRVQRAIHVSTGAGGATPVGHFRIYRRDPMSWSVQFHVWMPLAQYFYRGYAVHEFASVPAYPASHGCVRVPQSESRAVWHFGSIGLRVWTRR